jgi:hypothetical protein
MTAGTLAGELSALSGTPRNATVVAERVSVVWKMSAESYERLEREQGAVAKAFVTLVLKGVWVLDARWTGELMWCVAAKQDYDVLLAAVSPHSNMHGSFNLSLFFSWLRGIDLYGQGYWKKENLAFLLVVGLYQQFL